MKLSFLPILFLLQTVPSPSSSPEITVTEIKEPVAVKVQVSDILTSGGIVTILGGVGLLVTTFFTAYTSYKTKNINEVQNKKLDNVTLLVDGRYGAVLQELADMKKLFADLTGTKIDQFQADKAQSDATAQHIRSEVAKESVK